MDRIDKDRTNVGACMLQLVEDWVWPRTELVTFLAPGRRWCKQYRTWEQESCRHSSWWTDIINDLGYSNMYAWNKCTISFTVYIAH